MTTPCSDPGRWARAMREPGAAVVLDCETTGFDGSIVEIAVVDAATGAALLDTLVDPEGVAIEPGAGAVHGIGETELVGAPNWPQVLPRLVEVTVGRIVLAYNASFDRGRIAHDCARTATDPGDLLDENRWQCVMEQRSAALGTTVSLPLGGGHRALGDALAARDVLAVLAAGCPDTAGRAALAEKMGVAVGVDV